MRPLDDEHRAAMQRELVDLAERYAALHLADLAAEYQVEQSRLPERVRNLAILAVFEAMAAITAPTVGKVAELAAKAGADYADIARVIGLTRQTVRKKWPHLRGITLAAREAEE